MDNPIEQKSLKPEIICKENGLLWRNSVFGIHGIVYIGICGIDIVSKSGAESPSPLPFPPLPPPYSLSHPHFTPPCQSPPLEKYLAAPH